jgi:hypothetical protein
MPRIVVLLSDSSTRASREASTLPQRSPHPSWLAAERPTFPHQKIREQVTSLTRASLEEIAPLAFPWTRGKGRAYFPEERGDRYPAVPGARSRRRQGEPFTRGAKRLFIRMRRTLKEQGISQVPRPSSHRQSSEHAAFASRSRERTGAGVVVPTRRSCPGSAAGPVLGGATKASTRSPREARGPVVGCETGFPEGYSPHTGPA